MVTGSRIGMQAVTLGYGKGHKVTALCHIDELEFGPGDLVAVVGENGAGKSTLLRSFAGLQPVPAGKVLVDGLPVNSWSSQELATKIAVVLTQRFGGFNLKVRDAVAAGRMPYTGALHRLTENDRKIIHESAAACRIEKSMEVPVEELSDGMFQKTMIARALAQRTDILLLDEPSAFLDYASRHELFILLRRMADVERKCILICTHELELAIKYCGSILLMSGGTVRLLTAKTAAEDPAFRAIAGGYL